MRIGSLFSGAGGLDLAVQAVFGGEVVWHAEIDKAASKVLAYRFPGVLNLGDVSDINWDSVPPVDILCGGFPCQDVSAAGRRAGIKDGTRSGLWAVFAEAIDWLHPRIVVIENVRGLLSAAAHRMEPDETTLGNGSDRPVLRAAGAVLGDLADIGYDAQWATVAAADVGAPHRRERVFIVATDSACNGRHEGRPEPVRLQRGFDAAVSGDGHGVALLPTPRTSDTNGAGQHGDGGMDLRTTVTLLPTPNAQDGNGGGRYSSKGHQSTLPGEARLLCTPSAPDGAGGKTSRSGGRIDEPLLGGQAPRDGSGVGQIRARNSTLGTGDRAARPAANGAEQERKPKTSCGVQFLADGLARRLAHRPRHRHQPQRPTAHRRQRRMPTTSRGGAAIPDGGGRVNTCVCGHEPADHYCGTGSCEWLEDEFPCYCPRYEWQGDQ